VVVSSRKLATAKATKEPERGKGSRQGTRQTKKSHRSSVGLQGKGEVTGRGIETELTESANSKRMCKEEEESLMKMASGAVPEMCSLEWAYITRGRCFEGEK